MKTLKHKILAFVFSALALQSCQDYDVLVTNPNLPVSVPPSLLLTGILNSMNNENSWSETMWFNQFWISTYTYYGSNNYDQAPFIGSSFNYLTLQNVVQMEQEAIKSGAGDVNPYGAIAKFLKAYYFHSMSQKFGDIPLSEALLGSENTQPKYDSQKEVYVQILKLLDDSNTELGSLIASNNLTLSGDIYLSNNLKTWQKVVNAFTIRVLVALSKKDTDADLNVKQKFANIINNPTAYPLMGSNDDNLMYRYNAQFNLYPKNPGELGYTITRENVGKTFLDLTTTLQDPRTFIAAGPAPAQIASGKTIDDFTAYVGASNGDDMGTLGNNSQSDLYSFVNAYRYYSTYDGSSAEPSIIIGYPEMCLNVAEGINRGWTTGNAGTWYVNGIKASMNFFGIADGVELPISHPSLAKSVGTVPVSVTNYLAQPAVQYQGDNAAGLTQILEQKYIAFWQNSNWEAFFNARRTGVPAFLKGPGTGNNQKIPLRWQYPYAELTANTTNYNSAVQSQFSGVDDLNGKMWILQ